MNFLRILLLSLSIVVVSFDAHSDPGWVCAYDKDCGGAGGLLSGERSSRTSKEQLQVNPAAVPVEKGFGVEGILYDGSVDFGLVKGLGRVGAAISPSNSEETFFGPPAIENTEDFFERKTKEKKFVGHKTTVATAFEVYKNKKSGLKRFELSLGVLGKYYDRTHSITPGGGLRAVLGPFNVGFSMYKDQVRLNQDPQNFTVDETFKYDVQTYSVGFYLSSLILDYSYLKVNSEEYPSTISVFNATLLLNRFILSGALRSETSERAYFNTTTRELEVKDPKKEFFGGFQVRAAPFLLLGAFYNYYLLKEISFGVTVFF